MYPDDFYGFPEVPFHVYLGMTFTRPRPDGPAVVTAPALPGTSTAGGAQSLAAVYTVGEVACGVAVCDALLLHHTMADAATAPLVLTREVTFRPRAAAVGAIRSETWFVGDAAEARERFARARKLKVETEARLYGEDGELAGETRALFYLRLMDRGRLEAMAGTLVSTLSGQGAA
jgi:hypothetical protein